MALKPSAARVIDLETMFDSDPQDSVEGPVIWATVKIVYALQGLSPALTIRVPVPWNAQESPAQRRAQALRSARQLIDHACRAGGIGPAEAETDPVEDGMEGITPASLEGIAQELGLASPTTKPKVRRR